MCNSGFHPIKSVDVHGFEYMCTNVVEKQVNWPEKVYHNTAVITVRIKKEQWREQANE